MNKRFFRSGALLLAAVVCLAGCGDKKADAPVPDYVTIDYYSSPYEGQGTRNLLVRQGEQAELYTMVDTVKGTLNDAEKQSLASALQAVSKWDTTYEAATSERYEVIRKIHPEGISTIRRTYGSPAPDAVDKLLNQCASIAKRLRDEADKKKPAL